MRRWRPPLWLVLGGALGGTLIMALSGLVAFRYLGPEIGFRNAAMTMGVIITTVTAILGGLLVRLLLRPIWALEHYAASMRAGTGAKKPAHFGTRELAATARSVIEMGDVLHNREQTIRSFTDHVTHEIKTPVSAIRAAVELLEDGGDLSESDQRILSQISAAEAQIERQLDALRRAARARETRYLGHCDLAQVVADLQKEHPDIKLKPDASDGEVPLSTDGLRVVLGHLIGNAVAQGATTLDLRCERDGARLALCLRDNGSGISPGHRDRIFEPFFTTRRAEGGTGMGLAITRNILAAHGSEIHVLPGGPGATFVIRFPASDATDP